MSTLRQSITSVTPTDQGSPGSPDRYCSPWVTKHRKDQYVAACRCGWKTRPLSKGAAEKAAEGHRPALQIRADEIRAAGHRVEVVMRDGKWVATCKACDWEAEPAKKSRVDCKASAHSYATGLVSTLPPLGSKASRYPTNTGTRCRAICSAELLCDSEECGSPLNGDECGHPLAAAYEPDTWRVGAYCECCDSFWPLHDYDDRTVEKLIGTIEATAKANATARDATRRQNPR